MTSPGASSFIISGARVATWIVIGTVAWNSVLPGAMMIPLGRGYWEHFAAYAALGAIAGLAYGGGPGRFACLAAALVACAAAFEVFQIWAPGRTFSVPDLVISGLGGSIGLLSAWAMRLRMGRSNSPQ